MSNLDRIKAVVETYEPGETYWIIDMAPTSNEGFRYLAPTPVLKLSLTTSGWDEYEDPDIEMALFDEREDALGCIAEAVETLDKENDDATESVSYAMYETSKGFLVSWVDSALEFGGNIFAYGEARTFIQKAKSTYSDCHFGQNGPEIIGREGDRMPDVDMWVELLKEMGVAVNETPGPE